MSPLGQSRRRTRYDLPQAPQEQTPRVQGRLGRSEAPCDDVRVWQAGANRRPWRHWRPASACLCPLGARPSTSNGLAPITSHGARQQGLERHASIPGGTVVRAANGLTSQASRRRRQRGPEWKRRFFSTRRRQGSGSSPSCRRGSRKPVSAGPGETTGAMTASGQRWPPG